MFDINKFKDTYKGKTVLVTGHTGFKGSLLTVWLKKLGAHVVGLSDKYPDNNGGIKWLSNIVKPIDWADSTYLADIRCYNDVQCIMTQEQPDFVFHLAAQALVRKSYADPMLTFETNTMGTLNVLNAFNTYCKITTTDTTKHKALVCITSDKCYQNVEQMWGYRENDRMGGDDPYSASKGAAELIINAYTKSFLQQQHDDRYGIASVRAGNVIGGGDCSVDRLIPDCVRAIVNNENIEIRSPSATRPWLHVLEPLSGYLLVGQELYNDPQRFSTGFNFGPQLSDNKTVGEVVELFVSNFDTTSKIILGELDNAKKECGLLNLDVTKSSKMLDWSRRWPIETALEKTAEWYKTLDKDGALATFKLTLKHIDEYCNTTV